MRFERNVSLFVLSLSLSNWACGRWAALHGLARILQASAVPTALQRALRKDAY